MCIIANVRVSYFINGQDANRCTDTNKSSGNGAGDNIHIRVVTRKHKNVSACA